MYRANGKYYVFAEILKIKSYFPGCDKLCMFATLNQNLGFTSCVHCSFTYKTNIF